jgi:hypothetical protein
LPDVVPYISTKQTYTTLPATAETRSAVAPGEVVGRFAVTEWLQITGTAPPASFTPCARVFGGAGEAAVAYGAGDPPEICTLIPWSVALVGAGAGVQFVTQLLLTVPLIGGSEAMTQPGEAHTTVCPLPPPPLPELEFEPDSHPVTVAVCPFHVESGTICTYTAFVGPN